MVILVRCCDGTCSLALQSRLGELIKDGLVTAFLRDGEWVMIGRPPVKRDRPATRRPGGRVAALVSSF
ncbi:MAG: hypothetical protein NDI77_04030 [Geobacteraceae bacterium]|nr:hypothetical protein [Geobacteraceae bacterium]